MKRKKKPNEVILMEILFVLLLLEWDTSDGDENVVKIRIIHKKGISFALTILYKWDMIQRILLKGDWKFIQKNVRRNNVMDNGKIQ